MAASRLSSDVLELFSYKEKQKAGILSVLFKTIAMKRNILAHSDTHMIAVLSLDFGSNWSPSAEGYFVVN